MARDARKAKKRVIQPDERFKSVLVAKFINKMMLDGKKSVAEKCFYDAMDIIAEKTKREPLEVFEEAMKNASPTVMVKSRRVGGSNYQIPIEVKGDRKNHYGMIWLRDAARKRAGEAFANRLSKELMDAAASQGSAVKKREEAHRMADANKAFAHFARY